MAATAKKVLLLRSAEGKVLMAPTWDGRPFPHFLPPMETGLPTRALEKVIGYWTIHNRATNRGHPEGDLLEWDLEFVRRLAEEEGLLEEAHAAAVLLQRRSLADLIELFARSRPRPEHARPCIDDVPPLRSAPATRRLRRKVISYARRTIRRPPAAASPKRKVLSHRVHPLLRKSAASTVPPATS